jgi:hypothetical protein
MTSEILEKATTLLNFITAGLEEGVKFYTIEGHLPLETAKDVLEALTATGSIAIEDSKNLLGLALPKPELDEKAPLKITQVISKIIEE